MTSLWFNVVAIFIALRPTLEAAACGATGGDAARSRRQHLPLGDQGILEKTLSVAQRYAEFLKVLVGQLRQDVCVDFALAERRLVLTKSKASRGEPHHRGPFRRRRELLHLRAPHETSKSARRSGVLAARCPDREECARH
jgi:hypothetical protein